MRHSELFTETIKEAPKDETSRNAQLLIQAGFIDKLTAGVYSFLPLGLIVLKKIENIIREEMNKIGGREVLLPALHPKSVWEKTGRWAYEEMFKLKNRQGHDFSLGWTHEEIITPLVKRFVNSYKKLPVSVFQIQDKFRDELRAKSGLLRGREFIMKDLYSFHAGQKDLDKYYETVKSAYFDIFKRCGLAEKTFLTLASGGTFSKYSHEFQTATSSGEDQIYLCRKCKIAVNKEIIEEENNQCPQCHNKNLEELKAIEVGNIFKLNDKYSRPLGAFFKDKDGKSRVILMGCYGIGLSRLMGAIVEVYNDERGIIWPKEVAPFRANLIQVGDDEKAKNIAGKLYQDLQKQGVEVLYDDREDKSAGQKFADADLIGAPFRIVVSKRTLANDSAEIKKRDEQNLALMKIKEIIKYVQ